MHTGTRIYWRSHVMLKHMREICDLLIGFVDFVSHQPLSLIHLHLACPITEVILGSPPTSLTSQMTPHPPKASLNVLSAMAQDHPLGHLQQLLTSPSASPSIHGSHGFHGNSIETPNCSISSYGIYAQNPVLGPCCP